jgi:hypothetical protein
VAVTSGVAVASDRGALTALFSAADAIEIAAKVATIPNSSADDASNVFIRAPPVMRWTIAERRVVAVTGITKRAGLTRRSAVAAGFLFQRPDHFPPCRAPEARYTTAPPCRIRALAVSLKR